MTRAQAKTQELVKKGQVFVRKKDGLKSKDPITNYWFVTDVAAFHMTGLTGHGIYKFPALTLPQYNYDTNWTFDSTGQIVDSTNPNAPSYTGSIYKEDGSSPTFYMFFGEQLSTNGKYPILYSFGNQNYDIYDWAE